MSKQNYIREFERIITQLFKLMNFQTRNEIRLDHNVIDLIAQTDSITYYIDIKFFRSRSIPATTLKDSANKLAYYLRSMTDGTGIIAINTIVPLELKDEISDEFRINIWDRGTIYNSLTELSIELRDEFEKLLLAVQQGIETINVFSGINVSRAIANGPLLGKTKPIFKKIPDNKGQQLLEELNLIQCGKAEWSKYESKCLEILEFLFENDLTLWEKQNRTEDGLSRFDLICRVASIDDYWKALVKSFNTRFILFEFKNYCNPIDQGQIYTTERYLFNKALRSVGFIIARKGANTNAQQAAKGALKENGKLILILSNNDLENMLKLKDNNGSPNDYLSNLLDIWLIALSR